ncbi:MAG: hypothetical protein OES13_08810 [Acidimicrobiia bacterium]|nr:hypothetical protein [Acidimicrobiia bacterium]
MAIDRDVIDAVKEMDQHELRRLLMLTQARLEGSGLDNGGAVPNVSFRRRLVKCGKEACSSCPHGPYWYAYWRENGRRHSRYVGRLEDVDTVDTTNTPSA